MQNGSDPNSQEPILVPVDFSPQSKVAALTASELAGRSTVPILLLHVVHESGEQPGYYREHDNGKMARPFDDIAAELLDRFLGELRFDHPEALGLEHARTMTVAGLPSQRIVEVAEKVNALMVIMGSRGRLGLPHWLIGSVAEQVTRHCLQPVTVIKDTDFENRRRTGLKVLHSWRGEPVPEKIASL
jgi:nucleotide-binding universal stress UspA family protein